MPDRDMPNLRRGQSAADACSSFEKVQQPSPDTGTWLHPAPLSTPNCVEGWQGPGSPAKQEAGGLSGRPLFAPSTALLGEMYRLTGGRLPLIGVGGIASAEDAYAKIRAGASLVQLYTALIVAGPKLVGQIKSGLANLLERDGFGSIAEAVGSAQGQAPVGQTGSLAVP